MTSDDGKHWMPTDPRDEKRLIEVLARMVEHVLYQSGAGDLPAMDSSVDETRRSDEPQGASDT